MLLLLNLLEKNGFDLNNSFKLVRHKSNIRSMENLIENNLFENYQCLQRRDVFECDYIISFIGKESTKALFWGIYKVNGKINASQSNLTDEYISKISITESSLLNYYYLEKQNGFEDLEQRIIIDWGEGTRSWVQNKCDKHIIEIKPKGFVEDFTGYLDFAFSFKKLEQIIKNADANYVWKNKLSAVMGIYLILDRETGKQYIGSAYGKNGIWGRWENYIKTGSGGNDLLEELLESNDMYKYNFQFTILQTLPSNLTPEEIINYEKLYKDKLGSRSFGLNKN